MYTIILSDGTRLENLKLNGNNFISDEIIDDAVFDGNLSKVVVTRGEIKDVYTDMRLLANRVIEGRSWFVIGEKSEAHKQQERIAQLEEELKAAKILLGLEV